MRVLAEFSYHFYFTRYVCTHITQNTVILINELGTIYLGSSRVHDRARSHASLPRLLTWSRIGRINCTFECDLSASPALELGSGDTFNASELQSVTHISTYNFYRNHCITDHPHKRNTLSSISKNCKTNHSPQPVNAFLYIHANPFTYNKHTESTTIHSSAISIQPHAPTKNYGNFRQICTHISVKTKSEREFSQNSPTILILPDMCVHIPTKLP